jgi:competence protein ComEA
MKPLLRLVCVLVLVFGVAAPASPQRPPPPAPVDRSSADPLDLNTATLDQLKSLPGMGEAYARRVIAGRPYTGKNQLLTRGILPQPAYEKMQALVVARHPRNK